MDTCLSHCSPPAKRCATTAFFFRYLDALFKTVNFQFKTRHNLDGKMLYFHRQIKLYTWNKTDLVFFTNIHECISFPSLFCLFAALLPTILQYSICVEMYMCVKYRCKCHWRHFPTITAAYEIHGPSTRQSCPKRELQQTCIQSDLQYNFSLPRNWTQVSYLLAINTNHCTTYHTCQSCHTKLISTNQQKSLFLRFFLISIPCTHSQNT